MTDAQFQDMHYNAHSSESYDVQKLKADRAEMRDTLRALDSADVRFMASLLLDKLLLDCDADDLARECFEALEFARKQEGERIAGIVGVVR